MTQRFYPLLRLFVSKWHIWPQGPTDAGAGCVPAAECEPVRRFL
jgi:hypothetical protein